MTRIAWNTAGSRLYEAGVDRGVLYVGAAPGVPWIGLSSVVESPSGGEPRPFYIDGVKYLNLPAVEEFEATIKAFTYPDEFGVCDGSAQARPGLYVTHQRRKPFGLSYRTKIGNDLQGVDFAYKIHIVTNALASPSERSNNTLSDSAEPADFTWKITACPPTITGYGRTAHIVIDSRYTHPVKLLDVENMLYGSVMDSPRIPTFDELITLFDDPLTMELIDNGDGTYTVIAPNETLVVDSSGSFVLDSPSVSMVDPDTFTITS
jgi:hypothetical protein